MGRDVTDLDLATDAEPKEMLRLAEEDGIKAVPTGIDHGTVTFVVDGEPYEITTFRNDVETDGRHATVAFSKDFREDAKRRDFTMNALYAKPDGSVLDPVFGLTDLCSGIVRFVGDATLRINEDYLRILRFFRFHAWYGNTNKGIEPEGLAACAEHVDQLPSLSRERVTAELLKLLSAPDPSMAVSSMDAIGALMHLLPGSSATALPVLIHLEVENGLVVDPIARLCALGGEPENHLRLSKAQERTLFAYREAYESPHETGYRLGELALHNLAIQAAHFGVILDSKQVEKAKIGMSAEFPVKAQDLMPTLSGKALGDKLKELEQRWIISEFQLTKDQLLD